MPKKIIIPAREFFDEKAIDEEHPYGQFVYTKPQEIILEHSLISLRKWESKWRKPFLDEKNPKTNEEFIDYIRCMSLKECPDDIFDNITFGNIKEIKDYIYDKHTATWFAQDDSVLPSHKVITAEVIYSWMILNDIPFNPCEKWHLSNLMTLIRVCAQQNMPAKKMSEKEILSQNAKLNAERLKAMKSKG